MSQIMHITWIQIALDFFFSNWHYVKVDKLNIFFTTWKDLMSCASLFHCHPISIIIRSIA